MQQVGAIREQGMLGQGAPLLVRFLGKIVLDVLPAALASVIGGFLFTQYQFGHSAPASPPRTEQSAPASAEMMKLVRDEHAMIVDFLNTQMAAEKTKRAAEDDASAHAAAEAKIAAAAPTERVAAAAAETKPAVPRNKPRIVVAAAPASRSPLVIARADTSADTAPVASPARPPASLLSKTLDIKDHVVDVTLHAVSAIGSIPSRIPSWIASMGDRIGGAGAGWGSAGRQASATS